jgi:dihydroflavonol-4-reductase
MSDLVLVTGGTGFVGGWVIVELLRRGYRVRAVGRNPAREADLRRAIGAEVDTADRLEFAVADLTADAGWAEAMSGCRYVQHIASPMGGLADEALVATALEGTRRVLSAALDAGVERVVMTSSMAACTPLPPPPDRAIDERDWTDPDQPGLAAYRRSKVLAEQAAWALMAGRRTGLTTLLPGAIFGPALTPDQAGSVGIIRDLMQGRPPMLPRLAFNITDVRDLAILHVVAMTAPEAAGERFIVMGEALWFRETAQVLKARLGPRAAKVSTRPLPDWAARLLAVISPRMKELLPLLGRTQPFSADQAKRVLGYTPRPAADTVADCGASVTPR